MNGLNNEVHEADVGLTETFHLGGVTQSCVIPSVCVVPLIYDLDLEACTCLNRLCTCRKVNGGKRTRSPDWESEEGWDLDEGT